MKKIYFSPSQNKEIVDLRGDFIPPDGDFQMVEIAEGEAAYVEGGILKKKNLKAEADAGKAGRKAKRDEDLALMGWDKQKLKAVKRLINSEED